MAAIGALAALLVLGAAAPATAGGDQDVIVQVPSWTPVPSAPDGTVISNAQLRWGLNLEAGAGAFAPGTCNFLSAGLAGDTGGSRTWTEADGLYRSRDGAVRIEKPAADGSWQAASFQNKCLDPQGQPVRSVGAANVSGNQVVIDGGTGSVTGGAVTIGWKGSFTVAFYSGMTYWSVTDPVLTVDASGSGRLTATAGGYGADMNDTEAWSVIPARSIVLAEVRRVDTSAGSGFSVVPEYLGVKVDTSDTPQTRTGPNWGSFPQSFVDFQQLTGQNSYWYSSGGAADLRKPATALYVSYDAASPIAVPTPATGAGAAGGGAAPSGAARMPSTVPAPNAAAAVPGAASAPLAVNASVTTVPEAAGLVPAVTAALSPLVVPLLGTAAALGLAIIAVLGLMQRLPWQRRPEMP